MTAPFQLAACAEMLWQDKPIAWRAAKLREMGFGVGLWNWPDWDPDVLEKTGANFTIMNGYLEGRFADDEGADMLLKSARETAQVGKRLGVERLNLHGTGLGDGGIPIPRHGTCSRRAWNSAPVTRSTASVTCRGRGRDVHAGKPEPAGPSGMPVWINRGCSVARFRR